MVGGKQDLVARRRSRGSASCWVLGMLLASMLLASASVAATSVEVVHRGAALRGAFGLHFAQGRLWVATPLGREIVALDPKTGAVLERLGPQHGIETPDDLVFGPDGSLYWSAIFADSVGRLTPSGEVRYQHVGPFTNGLAFSPDGRLYLSQCTVPGANGLWELDPALERPPRLITDSLGDACAVNGMDVGADGAIYGPRFFIGDVVRIDPESGEFTVLADGFSIPSALKLDAAGRVHVIDNATGEVYRVAGGEKELLATLEPGIDGMAFDPLDRLYVSRNIDGTIYRIEATGAVKVLREGGLVAPGGVVSLPRPDGGESIFVADLTSLSEIDAATGARLSLELSNDRTAMRRPFTLAGDGVRLVFSSWFDNAVQVYRADDRALVDSRPDFAVPTNATFFRDHLIVAEAGAGRVAAWSGEASRILIEDLLLPSGLLATDEALWVADWAAGKVWQLAADGDFLVQPTEIAAGLVTPEGLAEDTDGAILIVEANLGRILRLDPRTGERSVVASGLALGADFVPGFGLPSVFHSGLEVTPAGTIWLGSDVDRLLYRIDRGEPCTAAPYTACLLGDRFRVDLDFRSTSEQRGSAIVLAGLVPFPSWAFFFDPQRHKILAMVRLVDRCESGGQIDVLGVSLSSEELHFGLGDTRRGHWHQQTTSGKAPHIWTREAVFSCR